MLVTVLLLSQFGMKLCDADQRPSVAQARQERFLHLRQEHLQNLHRDMRTLSDECHERGLTQAAADITAISLELTDPEASPVLPRMAQLPPSNNLPPEEQQWRNRLQTLRQDKAKELYLLARSALRADLPSMAYQLNLDVLRLDPDHVHARAVLGQQLFRDRTRSDDRTYAGEWVSPFEAAQRSGANPHVNHPEFGWIPVSTVPRYEEGLRPWRGQWISAQKEAELRRDFRNAWEVRSEHFLVKTNTSLEEGVEVSQKLEIFYDWMQTNFAAFFETPDALADRFEQAAVRQRGRQVQKPMKVHYYATRREYDLQMRGKVPPNVVTNGLYWEPDRTCYFFRNPENDGFTTVFHEATHQILDVATITDRQAASKRRQRMLRQRQSQPWVLCEQDNFWMIEGLACYLESFEIHEGVPSVGRPDYVRFEAAQQRLLHDNFYVPLQPFSGLGQKEFQQHPNIPQLYSQASGVVHFLLHYENGLYRDGFIRLLSAEYRPDLRNLQKVPQLDEILGVRFAVLDQHYRNHISSMAIKARQQQANRQPPQG